MEPETNNENTMDEAQAEKSQSEILSMLAQGKLKLARTFRADNRDVEELEYDFNALTGMELMEALDKGVRNRNTQVNPFTVTAVQALELFCAAAAKKTAGLDATDIRQGLSPMDAVKAQQIASVFFLGASREGNRNISKA